MALVTVDSAQIDSVVATLATFKADVQTALADIAAKLSQTGSTTPDPATAAAISGVLNDIATLDANVKAADPGPVTTTPVA